MAGYRKFVCVRVCVCVCVCVHAHGTSFAALGEDPTYAPFPYSQAKVRSTYHTINMEFKIDER